MSCLGWLAAGESKILDQYSLGRTVGQGKYGTVKVAKQLRTGQTVALKIVPRQKMDRRRLQQEIQMQRRLDHKHVARLFEVIETGSTTFLAMEFLAGGDLFNYLVKRGRLHEDESRRLFQQIIAGVEHCHSRRCVHRDLKLENIILDSRCNAKIVDFGLSAEIQAGTALTDRCGSPHYAAPELLAETCAYRGPEADIWSCGVVLYALLCNFLPFDAPRVSDIFTQIRLGRYSVPRFVSTAAAELLGQLLRVVPEQRGSIAQIKADGWFARDLPADLKASSPVAPPAQADVEVIPRTEELATVAGKCGGPKAGRLARLRRQLAKLLAVRLLGGLPAPLL